MTGLPVVTALLAVLFETRRLLPVMRTRVAVFMGARASMREAVVNVLGEVANTSLGLWRAKMAVWRACSSKKCRDNSGTGALRKRERCCARVGGRREIGAGFWDR